MNNERLIIEDYENEFFYKKKNKTLKISFNRIAFVFFAFLFVCLIYSIKVIYLGSVESKFNTQKEYSLKNNYRADIIDRNGDFLVKTVNTINIGINPKLIIDKQKLLINLQIIFPEKDFKKVDKKISKKKFFYLEKKVSQEVHERLRMLGDKSIIPEEKITRVYVQQNLFSHILGQIDDSNNGISGIEKFFDQDLKTRKEPLKLTVDTNIQFLIREQLLKFQEIFKSQGSAAILMDVNNGDIISMVSLPDFNLNKRQDITDLRFINRATKGVYELGSVFKTFTFAAGINEKEIEPDTLFENLPKNLTCAGRPIREYDKEIPSNLTSPSLKSTTANPGFFAFTASTPFCTLSA